MDAQLNIQNGAFISTLYSLTKNVYERATYCIVHSSSGSPIGKTHLALDLLEREYKNHFDFDYNNLSHVKT